jgi:hypothetical protein
MSIVTTVYGVTFKNDGWIFGLRWTTKHAQKLIRYIVATRNGDVVEEDFQIHEFMVPDLREAIVELLEEIGIVLPDHDTIRSNRKLRLGHGGEMVLQGILSNPEWDDPIAHAFQIIQSADKFKNVGIPFSHEGEEIIADVIPSLLEVF